MSPRLWVVWMGCLLPAWGMAGEPRPLYRIETKPAQRVQATLTLDVTVRDVLVNDWVVATPVPPTLPYQTAVTARLEPAGQRITEPGPLQRELLVAQVAAKGAERRKLPIKVVYAANLYQRRLVPLDPTAQPPGVPDLTGWQRQLYLDPTSAHDFRTTAFKAWLEENNLVRQSDLAPVSFARLALKALRRKFTYKYEPSQDRSASKVIADGYSDCSGLVNLYVAILRANSIPARVVVGRWAKSALKNDQLGDIPYHQWHIRTEFYADRIGWVPVDVSNAVEHAELDENQVFGCDLGNFLVFHLERDVKVDSVHFGIKTYEQIQMPLFWVTAKGEPKVQSRQDWKVVTVPWRKEGAKAN